MAKNHFKKGDVMTWTNATGSAVVSGQVVLAGLIVCIALGGIAAAAVGEVATEEVWEVPKNNALAVAQGDLLYWDVADAEMNKTAEDNYLAGYAFAAAAETATTVKVKLGRYGLLTNLVG